MKRNLFATLLLTVILSANSFSQDLISTSKDLGLISYLTTIKSVSEFKMVTLASDPIYKAKPNKAKAFQAEYNLLKLSIDRFINQLVVDMTSKNRLKEYKKINKFIKGDSDNLPEKMNAYKKSLEEIEGRFETFILKTYSSMAAGPGIEEILGIVELTHGIIADARDFREKKVSNVNAQLDKLKLTSLKDLTEKKKKE